MSDNVQIQVVPSPRAGRQIGPTQRVTESLKDRANDILEAIQQGAALAVAGAKLTVTDSPDWRIDELEVTFGISLSAEAGVIVSKIATEASLEAKIVVRRCEDAGQLPGSQ